jgi:Ca2+-binding RTX toxin-like protein
MTVYALDLAAAQTASNAAVQAILNTVNPTMGALTDAQLADFESQLAAIGSSGGISLQNVNIDAAESTSTQTIYDTQFTLAHGVTAQAGDGFDTITATGGDTVWGSTSAEGGANIVSNGGANLLIGGAGADTLAAGSGNDTLVGGAGNETLTGSSSAKGGAELWGGSGDQVLKAGAGSDTLHAGTGNDTLYGGSGSSTVYAGYGHDTIYGGGSPLSKTTVVVASDTFNNDVIKGGPGTTILDLADLNKSDVAISTNSKGVTTVSYEGQSLSLTKVSEVDFANGQHLKL